MSEDPRQNFFSDVADPSGIAALFDFAPGVCLFVKDLDSRFVYVNSSLLSQLGMSELSEIVGTCDTDYYPEEYCEQFRRDDLQVFSSGEPILNRIEMGFPGVVLDWYSTTKLPVFDKKGQVKGLMGITRVCHDEALIPSLASQEGVTRLMIWLRSNHNRRVKIDEMAEVAGISVTQLRKNLQQTFGINPQEFEVMSRVQGASRILLETKKSLAEIATDFGFCDQSAFSNQFKKRIGLTPSEFRSQNS